MVVGRTRGGSDGVFSRLSVHDPVSPKLEAALELIPSYMRSTGAHKIITNSRKQQQQQKQQPKGGSGSLPPVRAPPKWGRSRSYEGMVEREPSQTTLPSVPGASSPIVVPPNTNSNNPKSSTSDSLPQSPAVSVLIKSVSVNKQHTRTFFILSAQQILIKFEISNSLF